MSCIEGWRVLLPRQPGRASSLLTKLDREGAVAQAIAMIAISPPDNAAELDTAVMSLAAGDYDWVGFTSVNAVSAVLDRCHDLALEPGVPASTRVACVGPATAAALRTAGLPIDLMPTHGGSAKALAECWPTAAPSESVLLPGSSIGQPDLAEWLQGKGFRVDRVAAYRTDPVPPPPTVITDLASGAFSAVLFTSPSTVAALRGTRLAAGTVVGAIGPTTAAAAIAAGFQVSFIAATPTDDALIAGLVAASAGLRTDSESPAAHVPSSNEKV